MIRLVVLFSYLFFLGCNNVQKENIEHINPAINQPPNKQNLIDVNKNWIKDESFLIDQFCKRHHLDVVLTPTGVRYTILENTDGVKPYILHGVTFHHNTIIWLHAISSF